jgi:hypothetical protein
MYIEVFLHGFCEFPLPIAGVIRLVGGCGEGIPIS